MYLPNSTLPFGKYAAKIIKKSKKPKKIHTNPPRTEPAEKKNAGGVHLSEAFTSPRLGAKRRTWGQDGYRVGTSKRFTFDVG